MTIINELNDFISQTKEAREVKRALAAKMILSGKSYHEIMEILQVSSSFISYWKNQALFQEVESLKLQYKGSQGYLNSTQKTKVIEWIQGRDYLRVSDLKRHLYQEYNVVYASDQSYYDLLKSAKMSWKKAQKKNPKKDEELVKQKKEEIEKKLKSWEEDIKAGKLAVGSI